MVAYRCREWPLMRAFNYRVWWQFKRGWISWKSNTLLCINKFIWRSFWPSLLKISSFLKIRQIYIWREWIHAKTNPEFLAWKYFPSTHTSSKWVWMWSCHHATAQWQNSLDFTEMLFADCVELFGRIGKFSCLACFMAQNTIFYLEIDIM